MAGIFHPSRGGVRGGQDQFNWDDVRTDKDRECYLGHSVMVPVGKWQEGKDLIWYTRDKQQKAEAEEKRRKELRSVKDMEARAMAAALGHQSFATGTTSLTAKELQEVLSRGQTDHGSADVVKGMGYTKPQRDMQKKYGTEFVGGMEKMEGNQGSNIEPSDGKQKRSKKRKKEKRKKKTKRKKNKNESEEDYSEEETGYSKTPRSSRHTTHKMQSKDNGVYKGKKRQSRDSNDGWSSRRRDGCNEENEERVKRYNDNGKYNEKKRKYEDSEGESPVRINRNSRINHISKGQGKRVKDSRYYSEDESEENSNRKYQCTSQTKSNSSRKSHSYSQPEDTDITFTSRNKRKRRSSSPDSRSG